MFCKQSKHLKRNATHQTFSFWRAVQKCNKTDTEHSWVVWPINWVALDMSEDPTAFHASFTMNLLVLNVYEGWRILNCTFHGEHSTTTYDVENTFVHKIWKQQTHHLKKYNEHGNWHNPTQCAYPYLNLKLCLCSVHVRLLVEGEKESRRQQGPEHTYNRLNSTQPTNSANSTTSARTCCGIIFNIVNCCWCSCVLCQWCKADGQKVMYGRRPPLLYWPNYSGVNHLNNFISINLSAGNSQ